MSYLKSNNLFMVKDKPITFNKEENDEWALTVVEMLSIQTEQYLPSDGKKPHYSYHDEIW